MLLEALSPFQHPPQKKNPTPKKTVSGRPPTNQRLLTTKTPRPRFLLGIDQAEGICVFLLHLRRMGTFFSLLILWKGDGRWNLFVNTCRGLIVLGVTLWNKWNRKVFEIGNLNIIWFLLRDPHFHKHPFQMSVHETINQRSPSLRLSQWSTFDDSAKKCSFYPHPPKKRSHIPPFGGSFRKILIFKSGVP